MHLSSVVPWGRNLAEYQRMFGLTPRDLEGKILGVGDGPASFNAELSAKGGQVVSIDPIYKFSRQEIARRIDEITPVMRAELNKHSANYLWKDFSDVDQLVACRTSSMSIFLEDYEHGIREGRYLEGVLPRLPASGVYDLALCSHLLFLYEENLNFEFHINSLLEICRVSDEARVYPLVNQAGKQSRFLNPSLKRLNEAGYHCHVVQVDYCFQRGANEMLVIRRR
ncbi:MAG: SAM-dependent methyltransferase [Marinobacter sp.]|nr:SAM-dependent methyltransferase [Marinobacter sp.]|tara:strand:+ start:7772 stop:8446 length:675 start_codon:yes stop_codon:yes gene_type:complete